MSVGGGGSAKGRDGGGLEPAIGSRHPGLMAISEAQRAELYTGLVEVLGSARAEILMNQLPKFDPAEVATKSDFAAVRSDFDDLRSDFMDLRTDFMDLRTDLKDLSKDLNARLDRLYTTLVAGLFVIVAAMAGVFFTTL